MAATPSVAFLGPLGPAQLACFRSWQRAGVRTVFLHTEAHVLPRFAQRIVSHYVHLGPLGDFNPAVTQRVAQALAESGSEALVCLGEQLTIRLWDRLPQLPAGIRLLANSRALMHALESKQLQIEMARSAGFDVLPSFMLDSAQGESLPAALTFPLVLRPDRASRDSAFKVQHIADQQALSVFMAARRADAPAVVAQPFIAGPNLIVHGSRAVGSSEVQLVTYLARLKHEGVTVTIEPVTLPAPVANACRQFVLAQDITGVFHFDLLQSAQDGRIWFLEINARLGGTTGKVFISGHDEPLALLQVYGLANHATPDREFAYKSVVNRLAALKCLVHGMASKGSAVDYPFPSKARILRRALWAMATFRDEVINPRNLRGTLAFFAQYLP